MKFTRILTILGLSLVTYCVSGATPARMPLVDIYNSFIANYSDGNPAWKTNITFDADIKNPPAAPFKLYYSDTFGYYSYRPKTWNELDNYEQFAVKTDPRLPHFLKETFGKVNSGLADTQSPKIEATVVVPASATASVSVPATPSLPPIVKTQPDVIPAPSPAIAGATPVLVPAPTNLDRVDHVLVHEQKGVFGYSFAPDDVITTKPVKLVEVGAPQ